MKITSRRVSPTFEGCLVCIVSFTGKMGMVMVRGYIEGGQCKFDWEFGLCLV